MSKDPRIVPKEGDVLYQNDGDKTIIIDRIMDGVVYYRVIDEKGWPINLIQLPLKEWCKQALAECAPPKSLVE